MNIKILETIKQFNHNGVACGVYKVEILETSWEKEQVFIQHGDSVGIVTFLVGKPATECISPLKKGAVKIFMDALKEKTNEKSNQTRS